MVSCVCGDIELQYTHQDGGYASSNPVRRWMMTMKSDRTGVCMCVERVAIECYVYVYIGQWGVSLAVTRGRFFFYMRFIRYLYNIL